MIFRAIKKSLVSLLVVFLFTLPLVTHAQEKSNDHEGAKKFDAMLRLIDYAYVEPTDENELVETAIVAMLKELDPHSVYIPEEKLKQMNEPLEGNFEGIGIRFNILRDTVVVVSAIPGGPSEELGILPGDKIVTVDGEDFAGTGITNRDVADKLRGEKGTRVTVGVKRKGKKELIDFTITRDKIPIFSLDASYMAAPGVGYVKLNRFSRKTMMEFHEAMDELKKEDMKNLILDLRGNSGGYLQTAIELADEFLEKEKLIVYTQGLRHPKREYKATSKGDFEKGKLVVLTDGGSASASEIVAGAVQDWDRGLIIGRRSFGKGLVQKPYPLPDGSAVRLTTARYYTPTGRCIQRPYKNGKDKYYEDIRDRLKEGELSNPDSIELPDSLKYNTPNGRVVYGGGGIMPDIFVPLDTTQASDLYGNLARKGVFNSFVLSYLDKNRKVLKKEYPEFEAFKEKFEIDDDFMQSFFEYAEEQGVEKDNEDLEKSGKWIKMQLKASFARDIWGRSEYFEIINQLNDSYKKALEVIKDDTFKEQKLTYR